MTSEEPTLTAAASLSLQAHGQLCHLTNAALGVQGSITQDGEYEYLYICLAQSHKYSCGRVYVAYGPPQNRQE